MLTKADSKDIELRSEKSNTGNKHLNNLFTGYEWFCHNLPEVIDKIEGKLKQKLIEGKEDGLYSKNIATICRDVPLDFEMEDIAYTGIKDSLIEFYQRLDMVSLIKKISFNNKEKFAFENNTALTTLTINAEKLKLGHDGVTSSDLWNSNANV